MTKSFKLTLAAGFLSASALLAPSAFAQTATETGVIQTAINQDAGLHLSHINVQTLDGVVYLQGRADSAGAAERAEEIARAAANGAKIVNGLGDGEFQG